MQNNQGLDEGDLGGVLGALSGRGPSQALPLGTSSNPDGGSWRLTAWGAAAEPRCDVAACCLGFPTWRMGVSEYCPTPGAPRVT